MLAPSIFRDNFVDDFFNDMVFAPFGYGQRGKKAIGMSADVQEFEDRFQVDLELPGFQKEDIQAELKDGYLTITASHSESNEEKNKKGEFIRRERYTGECSRSFYVGENVTQEDISAGFENGILKLSIPKKEAVPKVEERKLIEIR
ncbi:MAG: Hsp20/alpha crystallin family protein [Lachnospiraceae bacterium]